MFKLKIQKRDPYKDTSYVQYRKGITKFYSGDLIHVKETDEWYCVDHISMEGDARYEKVFVNIVGDMQRPGEYDYLPDKCHYKIVVASTQDV